MDIFFTDPTAIPLPPDKVRIKQLRAEPWQDNRRVRVYLEITPFQQRPNSEIVITDDSGKEVANVSIIETIDPRMEFTMHLRSQETAGEYHLTATLFYEVNIPDPEAATAIPAGKRERSIVDQATTKFSV